MSAATVLVVDDDRIMRRLLVSRLIDKDTNVIEAEDGHQAFMALQSQRVDLVIIDLEMPVMDGHQLLGVIRGYPKLRHLPVIVLTSKEDRASHERALSSGATSLLIKPLSWSVFGPHIRHILELSRATRQALAEAGEAPALLSA